MDGNYLRAYYRSKSDDELVRLAPTLGGYAVDVQDVVAAELTRRGIPIGATAALQAADSRRRASKIPLDFRAEIFLSYLGCIRWWRRCKWKLFNGPPPRWVDDLSGVLGWFNILRLLPTCLAVSLVPDRFL